MVPRATANRSGRTAWRLKLEIACRGDLQGRRSRRTRDLDHQGRVRRQACRSVRRAWCLHPDLPSQAPAWLRRDRRRLQEARRRPRGVRRCERPVRARSLGGEVWRRGEGAVLSDGNAEFTKKIGMDFDGSGFGLGTRSKRYSALVEDGVVKILNVEDSPAVAEASTASGILQSL